MISTFKKYGLVAAGAAAALVGFAPFAFASGGTYITLPSTALADVTGYAGALFTDLWVVIALAIGLPLAFYIIRKVIGLVRAR